jgi:hypothetical protein
MKNNIRFHLIFWFLLLIGIGLRIYNLNQTLGPGDENQYLLDYGNASLEFISTTFFFGGHHIFHTLIMRLMIMLFGDENAIAIRFPAFICGLGSLLIIYKISCHVFKSKSTPLISLTILVFSPISIYYSNIARGYSFIIFFSALMILSAIRIFESGRFGIWGWILSLSAFLSTYTIATNVYFVFGLGCWIALVVFTPKLFRETGFAENERSKVVINFLTIFLVAGLLTLLAYWPVLNDLQQEAKSFHIPMTAYKSNFLTVYELIKGSLNLIFYKNLIYFFPLIFLGIISGDVKRQSYRILAISILTIPYLIPLTTSVGGYSRNFLFILPLVIPFLGEGLVAFGLSITKKLNRSSLLLKNGLAAIFISLAISQTFLVYFPSSIKGFDLDDFKKDMRQFVNPLDLLIVADSRNYWYSHNIYNTHLKQSIFANKIYQVKVLAKDKEKLGSYKINDGTSNFPIFKNFLEKKEISSNKTHRGLSIFSLNKQETLALFEEDFESKNNWIAVDGKGTLEIEKQTTLVGNTSIKISNENKDKIFVVQANMNKIIQIGKPMFFVLLWGGLESNEDYRAYELFAPTLTLENTSTKEQTPLPMGQLNVGMYSFIDKATDTSSSMWMSSSYIGIFSPGEFILKLRLAAKGGQTAIFDGIRLFLFDLSN